MENQRSLEERIEYLEKRVDILEKKLKSRPQPQQEELIPKVDISIEPRSPSEQKPIEWDVVIFQKILPRLFIFVLIIGVLWGLKAVSDYGLLTDSVKILLGFLVSGSLILLGILQTKKSRTILGHILLGGSIPILMLTTFAMHQLYHFTGPEITFVLNIIWIGLGVFFTKIYKSQGIGVVASIVGVLVPFLIKSASPNIPVFVFYETMLYTVFLWLALKHRYQVLYFVSAIFMHLALLGFVLFVQIPEGLKWVAIAPVVIQQFALLTGFLITKVDLRIQAYSLFTSLLLTSIWITAFFSEQESAVVFGTLAILYGVCIYVYQKDSIRAPIFIANSLISVLIFAELLISDLAFEVLVSSSIIYMFVAQKYKNKFHLILSLFMYILGLGLVINQVIESWVSWEMLHWISFLAATIFGIYYLTKTLTNERKLIFNIGFPYITILFLAYTSMLAKLIAGQSGIDVERMIMAILWIAISIGFMVLGRLYSITQGKYVGVGILFFTLAKIILIDIYFVSVTFRALLFIILGVVGLLVSRAYYKQ